MAKQVNQLSIALIALVAIVAVVAVVTLIVFTGDNSPVHDSAIGQAYIWSD